MPLGADLAKSLTYLRQKYKVSERDLIALAKRLQQAQEPEDNFEENLQKYLAQRRNRRRNGF
jgi:hypothetical protein